MLNMKRFVVIISLFFLFSCSEKIDVRENEVLLTVVNQKADQLLRSGQHVLPKGTKGVYYTLGEEKISFDFDFLFKDDHVGHIQFGLTFAPRVDSLVNFFNEYKSDAFSVVVEVELKRMVRALLEKNYNKGDLSPAEIQKLISTKIENRDGVLRYAELKNLSPVIVTL
jgi:hypothetical protein